MNQSLLKEIKADFEWLTGHEQESFHWIKRLNVIAESIGKRIFIFIDGWNEVAENAFLINDECKRLNSKFISVIISTTTPSLKRLLKDAADNLGHIAEKTNLNDAILKKITVEPLRNTSSLSIVQIEKFNSYEIEVAKAVYSKAYNTEIKSNINFFDNPFYLRLASEQYANGTVPELLTQSELIEKSLIKKGARRGIDSIRLLCELAEIAKVFSERERPINILEFGLMLCSEEKTHPWVESAILIIHNAGSIPKIDFYYSHDLDYCISILYKKWNAVFADGTDEQISEEFRAAVQFETSRSALTWFLNCVEYYEVVKRLFRVIEIKTLNQNEKQVLANAIFNQSRLNGFKDNLWLEETLADISLSNIDYSELDLKEELPQLVYTFVRSVDSEKDPERFTFWLKILISCDYTIDEVGCRESYTFDFLEEKWGTLERWSEYEEDSAFDENPFIEIILDNSESAAKRATIFYATFKPETFLSHLQELASELIKRNKNGYTVLKIGCEEVLNQLSDAYYGTMCPGLLTADLEPEIIKDEYLKQRELLQPILNLFYYDQSLVVVVST